MCKKMLLFERRINWFLRNSFKLDKPLLTVILKSTFNFCSPIQFWWQVQFFRQTKFVDSRFSSYLLTLKIVVPSICFSLLLRTSLWLGVASPVFFLLSPENVNSPQLYALLFCIEWMVEKLAVDNKASLDISVMRWKHLSQMKASIF